MDFGKSTQVEKTGFQIAGMGPEVFSSDYSAGSGSYLQRAIKCLRWEQRSICSLIGEPSPHHHHLALAHSSALALSEKSFAESHGIVTGSRALDQRAK